MLLSNPEPKVVWRGTCNSAVENHTAATRARPIMRAARRDSRPLTGWLGLDGGS